MNWKLEPLPYSPYFDLFGPPRSTKSVSGPIVPRASSCTAEDGAMFACAVEVFPLIARLARSPFAGFTKTGREAKRLLALRDALLAQQEREAKVAIIANRRRVR